MLLLLPVLKLNTLICDQSIFLLGIEKTSKICTKSVSDGEMPRDSNFTDAFPLCLTFSITASILDHSLSAPLRLSRWQVY